VQADLLAVQVDLLALQADLLASRSACTASRSACTASRSMQVCTVKELLGVQAYLLAACSASNSACTADLGLVGKCYQGVDTESRLGFTRNLGNKGCVGLDGQQYCKSHTQQRWDQDIPLAHCLLCCQNSQQEEHTKGKKKELLLVANATCYVEPFEFPLVLAFPDEGNIVQMHLLCIHSLCDKQTHGSFTEECADKNRMITKNAIFHVSCRLSK